VIEPIECLFPLATVGVSRPACGTVPFAKSQPAAAYERGKCPDCGPGSALIPVYCWPPALSLNRRAY